MQKTDTPAPVDATFTEVLCEELCSMEQLEAENARHLEARRAAVQLWTADIAEVRFKSFDTKASLRDHLRSVAALRALAAEQGWLEPERALPDEAELVALLAPARRAASTVSSVEPWRALVSAWVEEGVQGTTIHAALKRNHGYTGSYSAVYRMIASIRGAQPPEATVRLHFAPGEASAKKRTAD